MSKNVKGILAIVIVLAIAFAIYWFTRKKPSGAMDKKSAISIIVGAKSGRSESSLASFGEDYLIAWAQAIQASQPSFAVGGRNYSTASGMTLK